ncbi:hypothetical protein Leucomu_07470 [Leucobacter muris]|uniref:DUF4190 domain-containing protein n=1 Tax=Leucobacter muris TaxID=1935379 RepID=A0ABX5QFB9_9MICO|nr:DUF4190 domain-containing protein [Leucobacter muris]QAB17777.1 hypothetical protein Leucomu_07470 [Leucobacter muris]
MNNESELARPGREARGVPSRGLAIAALAVGSAAFLIGWTPFFGLAAGATAIILGVVALHKKQPKALSITGIALGGVAALTSIALTVFALAVTDWDAVATGPRTEQTAAEPSPSAEPEPTPTPTQKTPEATSKPKPEKKEQELPKPEGKPKPSTPTPLPAAEATSGGMTSGMAEVACENTAREAFPYGVKVHWFTGTIAERLENDVWFIKAEITPKNEYGTKIEGVVMECTVTGSEEAPQILAFDVY